MVAFSSTLIAFLSLGVFTLTVMVAEPYNQEIAMNYNNNIYNSFRTFVIRSKIFRLLLILTSPSPSSRVSFLMELSSEDAIFKLSNMKDSIRVKTKFSKFTL